MLGKAVFIIGIVCWAQTARAQIVIGDPLNASKTFSSYCMACHKSPAGLGRNMGSSGLTSFLRQHYTTGGQMSAAMSAYLLSAKPEARSAQPAAAEQRRATAASEPADPAGGQRKDAARSRSAARTAARQVQPDPEPPAAERLSPPVPVAQPEEGGARTSVASTLSSEPSARAGIELDIGPDGPAPESQNAAQAPARPQAKPAVDQGSFSDPSP